MSDERSHPIVSFVANGMVVIAVVSIVLAVVVGAFLLIMWVWSCVDDWIARNRNVKPSASQSSDQLTLLSAQALIRDQSLADSAPAAKPDIRAVDAGDPHVLALAAILVSQPLIQPRSDTSQHDRAYAPPTAPPSRWRRRLLKIGLAYCVLGAVAMAGTDGEDQVAGTLLYLAGIGWFIWRLNRRPLTSG